MERSLEREKAGGTQAATRLLIVSSYHRPCGIAQYLEALEGPLREKADCEVEIAALPVDLLRGQSPYARRAGEKLFAEIVRLARTVDVVNIQLEPGLFGLTPTSIWRRLKALISAGKRVIITYHTVPTTQSERFSSTLRGLLAYLRSYRSEFVFNRLFAVVRGNPDKFRHIVQTAREAELFGLLGVPARTIFDHPLAFAAAEERAAGNHEAAKKAVATRYGLPECQMVACFGFLTRYKGFEVAIRALQLLPGDVHLFIVGGLHPEGVQLHTVKQPYVEALVAETKRNRERVHFTGALHEAEFREMLNAADAVVLPYAEVGQTSSGPAALALDFQRPIYCSRTRCFVELDRYEPGMLSFFEIGNHAELAEKLRRNDAIEPSRVMARERYIARYNVETRARLYLKAVAELVGAGSRAEQRPIGLEAVTPLRPAGRSFQSNP